MTLIRSLLMSVLLIVKTGTESLAYFNETQLPVQASACKPFVANFFLLPLKKKIYIYIYKYIKNILISIC